jgi:hypothetical protein
MVCRRELNVVFFGTGCRLWGVVGRDIKKVGKSNMSIRPETVLREIPRAAFHMPCGRAGAEPSAQADVG